jgi:hypothetical protein
MTGRVGSSIRLYSEHCLQIFGHGFLAELALDSGLVSIESRLMLNLVLGEDSRETFCVLAWLLEVWSALLKSSHSSKSSSCKPVSSISLLGAVDLKPMLLLLNFFPIYFSGSIRLLEFK